MKLTAAVLGSTAVQKLEQSSGERLLVAGRESLTRADLARVGCFNFLAAKILTKVLGEIGAKSLRQVYEELSPRALALPGMGVISLAVLGAAFEAKGLGGDDPLGNWVKKHAEKTTTFSTVKRREEAERAREAKERKRRERRRRNQASEPITVEELRAAAADR